MKNLYATLLSSDNYLYGAITLFLSLERVQTKYPFLVILTDNCSESTKQILQEYNIEFMQIPLLLFQNKENHWQSTINKFYIFNLEEYNKVCFLDADIILKENIDYIFEYTQNPVFVNSHYLPYWGGIFVIQPNKTIWQYIIKKYQNKCTNDEMVLEQLYPFHYLQFYVPDIESKFIHCNISPKWWSSLKSTSLLEPILSNFLQQDKYYSQSVLYISTIYDKQDYEYVDYLISLNIPLIIMVNQEDELEETISCYLNKVYIYPVPKEPFTFLFMTHLFNIDFQGRLIYLKNIRLKNLHFLLSYPSGSLLKISGGAPKYYNNNNIAQIL